MNPALVNTWSIHPPHVLGEEPPCPPRPEERLHLDGRPLPSHSLLLVRLPGKEAPPDSLNCYGRCASLRWVLDGHDGSLRRLRRPCCVSSLFFVSRGFFVLGALLLQLLFGTRPFVVIGCGKGLAVVVVVTMVVVVVAIPVGRSDGRVGGSSRAYKRGAGIKRVYFALCLVCRKWRKRFAIAPPLFRLLSKRLLQKPKAKMVRT